MIAIIVIIAVAVVVTLVSSSKAQAKKSKELYLDLFDEYESLGVDYRAALRLLTEEQIDNLIVPRDMEQCVYDEQLLTDEQLDYVAEEYSELFNKTKPRHLSLTLAPSVLAKISQ